MHCHTCPSDRHAYCIGQGCQGPSAAPVAVSPDAGGDLDIQVKRLDVENGDILVVRTKDRLTATRAAQIHDQVAALATRHGVRDVTVMVLDDCSDLTVERPGHVRIYKPASVGMTETAVTHPVLRVGGHQPLYAGERHPEPPRGGSGVKPPSVHPPDLSDEFRREAERVVAHAKATGDYRAVTHRHVEAAWHRDPVVMPGR